MSGGPDLSPLGHTVPELVGDSRMCWWSTGFSPQLGKGTPSLLSCFPWAPKSTGHRDGGGGGGDLSPWGWFHLGVRDVFCSSNGIPAAVGSKL